MSSPNEIKPDSGKHSGIDPTKDSEIPRFTIDLSLPPIKRYQHLAREFIPQIASLTALFSEVVPGAFFRSLLKLLLRRLDSREQTSELRGIHRVTGIGMHLLVAFNVLLDLFMGCTSGGVRVAGDRMLHFRTLDWGMHPLRKVVVHLDYVKDGNKVAEAISYVGYVGLLTGVRRSLSMSLNFRPLHNANSWLANIRFYFHHALVLFGFRPSISSLLRDILLARSSDPNASLLESTISNLPSTATTAAYLIFCDGERTITMEKDYNSAVVRSSPDFIVATNHDIAQEFGRDANRPNHSGSTQTGNLAGVLNQIAAHGVIAESSSRKRCMTGLWADFAEESSTSTKGTAGRRNRFPSQELIPEWLNTYPITNALTHYAAVMDPQSGKIAWAKRYADPRALWDQLIQQDKIK